MSGICTVNDIPESATIVSVDHEIEATLQSIGLGEYAHEWGTLWVEAEDGEYSNVWGCCYLAPQETDTVYHLYGAGAMTWSEPADAA